jgi:hypothetical protein
VCGEIRKDSGGSGAHGSRTGTARRATPHDATRSASGRENANAAQVTAQSPSPVRRRSYYLTIQMNRYEGGLPEVRELPVDSRITYQFFPLDGSVSVIVDLEVTLTG